MAEGMTTGMFPNAQGERFLEPTWGRKGWVFWSFYWRTFLYSLLGALISFIVTFVIFFAAGMGGGMDAMEDTSSALSAVSMLITLPVSIYLSLYLPISALINKDYTDFSVALLPKDSSSGAQPIEKGPGIIIRVMWSYFWRVTLASMGIMLVVVLVGGGLTFGLFAKGMVNPEAGSPEAAGALVGAGLVFLIVILIGLMLAVSMHFLSVALNKDYSYFRVRFVQRGVSGR